MTVDIKDLDAHEQPSEELRAQWKTHSKADQQHLIDSGDIDDLESPERATKFCLAGTIPVDRLNAAFKHVTPPDATPVVAEKEAPIYFHPLLPGPLPSWCP